MPLQPKISPENLKLRIADREKEIPPADNPDGSFNLDDFRFLPGEYDKYTSWFTFAQDGEYQFRKHLFEPYINKDTTFLDLGALCGSWTLPALKLGAEVISIEPDLGFFKILENNVKLNAFERWTGYNYGVFDHNFKGDVYDMTDIQFISLNEINKPVDYIKIDVEGAEIEVLRGGANMLKRNRPILWIECHNAFDISVTMVQYELTRILDEYKIEIMSANLQTPHIFATPTEMPIPNIERPSWLKYISYSPPSITTQRIESIAKKIGI